MDRLWQRFNSVKGKRFVKFGLPFFVLVLGGSVFLEQFQKLKFQFGRQSTLIDPAELAKQGIEVRDRSEITLEAQYEKIKELDIDNWEQIRGPRPWEQQETSSH